MFLDLGTKSFGQFLSVEIASNCWTGATLHLAELWALLSGVTDSLLGLLQLGALAAGRCDPFTLYDLQNFAGSIGAFEMEMELASGNKLWTH